MPVGRAGQGRAGYRALRVDYRNGGFSYDVTQHGPAVAATYRF